MQMNFEECERRVLISEGGYTNDPRDPGGPTNWGITLADARLHWKPDATAEDVRNMPRAVAEEIYKTKYWDALNGDALPDGIDYTVFDYGVSSGIGRSGRVLRAALGLPTTDWRVGATVLEALTRVDHVKVVDAICAERLRFLQRLPIWDRFGRGWSARVASVKAYSEHLAQPQPVSPPHPENVESAKAYHPDGDQAPIDVEPLLGPLPAFLTPNAPQTATIDPIGSPLVSSEGPPATLVTPSDTPIPAKPPSMLKSKSGWAAVGLGAFGGSGVLDQLQQANDYASQISMAKFNLHELDVGAVLHWFVAHPAALLPILVIGAAAFVWEDHRKYKRLLMEAQRK